MTKEVSGNENRERKLFVEMGLYEERGLSSEWIWWLLTESGRA
jgi:hypothetical protein